MALDTILAAAIRSSARRVAPGEAGALERALALAQRDLAGGATTAQAYEHAQAFLAAWRDHPSHARPRLAPTRRAS
jgi:hypothetical protein